MSCSTVDQPRCLCWFLGFALDLLRLSVIAFFAVAVGMTTLLAVAVGVTALSAVAVGVTTTLAVAVEATALLAVAVCIAEVARMARARIQTHRLS